jgi:hypothetical protein
MSDFSARLALPFLLPSQAQKHVTVNDALAALDVRVAGRVEQLGALTPPHSPEEGACWLLGTAPTGEWSGQGGQIAAWLDGAWRFLDPVAGQLLLNAEDGRLVLFDGAEWGPAVPDTMAMLGINTVADSANKLAVKSDIVLFSHDDVTPGTGDCRVVCNKADTAGSGEILFQTNWSGRALLGTSGDDSFVVKVSADGASWKTALSADPATGAVSTGILKVSENLECTGNSWRANLVSVAADAAWGQFKGRRARGSLAVPTAVEAGDMILSLTPEAYDGSAYANCGGVNFVAEADFASSKSAYFRIATIDGGTWGERLRVRANGDVGIGTSSPAVKLDVAGPVRPASYTVASLPSASGIAGAIIFVSDAMGGGIPAFSDGTDWRRLDDRAVIS